MPTKNHGRMAQDMKRELIAIIGEMKDPRVNGGLLTAVSYTHLDVYKRQGTSSTTTAQTGRIWSAPMS